MTLSPSCVVIATIWLFAFVIINPTRIIPEFSLVGEKKIKIKEEEQTSNINTKAHCWNKEPYSLSFLYV